MKTPMNVFNTAMKKKKKNRKGFSLVELIVVLVIMAILAAALIPTLIGYIKQTRQSNAKNEAASAVSAAQTMASSAYANGDGIYYDQSQGGKKVQVLGSKVDEAATYSSDALAVVESLSEVSTAGGDVVSVTVEGGVVKTLQYKDKSGTVVNYNSTAAEKYTIGDKSSSPSAGESSK